MNPRPLAPKASALPSCATPRFASASVCARYGLLPVGYSLPERGRSSMAELQSSKLTVGVRFSSPAPRSFFPIFLSMTRVRRACAPSLPPDTAPALGASAARSASSQARRRQRPPAAGQTRVDVDGGRSAPALARRWPLYHPVVGAAGRQIDHRLWHHSGAVVDTTIEAERGNFRADLGTQRRQSSLIKDQHRLRAVASTHGWIC